MDGIANGLQMVPEIIDAVIILNRIASLSIRNKDVFSPESILGDEERFLIAFIHADAILFETSGVNCPSPLRLLQIRIANADGQVSGSTVILGRICSHTARHVIAEGQEVCSSLFQEFCISWFHVQ